MNSYLVSLVMMSLTVPLALGQNVTRSSEDKEPPLVKKIKKIDYMIQEKLPPNLALTVIGEVPTGGYTNVKLIRVKYKTPPKDGIQEYRLVATPPDGPATQVISEVKATDVIVDYDKHLPWIKGIRVLGAGDGVKVRMLNE